MIRIYDALSLCLKNFVHIFGVATQCHFPCSCSEFAKEEWGSGKSSFHSLQRIAMRLLICSPAWYIVSNELKKKVEIPSSWMHAQ